jgi:TnpA family transposase
LIASVGLSNLNSPIEDHLKSLEQQLEDKLATVNRRILAGENEAFAFKKRGQDRRWTLSQPRAEETINHPFFDTLAHVDLNTVLHFVNQRCRFMDAFVHVLGRYVKTQADERIIRATLTAWGTNMGLRRMGAISDIDFQTLTRASDNFLRLETLQPANDVVSNAIADLPIFHHYDLGDTLHSSSDGQRFETTIPTFSARHSPKYFGLKKGVVAYTLLANYVPLSAKIIGTDDHESHFVYDVLFNNTTDLLPSIHSTDTHGTNEVNFAILNTFGYQFAPRYRDIYMRVSTSLYGFKHPSQYPAEWPIRPIRKFKSPLIADEWDNIRRIMVSLALKTTTQSIIIRKLSSHARKNKTQRALWEYDRIFQSLYLLDYLDSPPLRRNVHSALNRGENYHQLRRAVSYANFGKLRFKTEAEQQLWSECSRLITNCIIFYNATLLSALLQAKEKRGETQQVVLLKHISPIAWQHVNFYGRYTFISVPELIDIEALILSLQHLTIRHYAAE